MPFVRGDDYGPDFDAKLLLMAIQSECNRTAKMGIKRSSDEVNPDSSHDLAYAASSIKNALSHRGSHALRVYSQAVAWLRGDSVVQCQDILSVAPFVLGHRLDFTSDYVAQCRVKDRTAVFGPLGAPIEMMCAADLVNDISVRVKEPNTRDLIIGIIKMGTDQDRTMDVNSKNAVMAALKTPQLDHPLLQEVAVHYKKKIISRGYR